MIIKILKKIFAPLLFVVFGILISYYIFKKPEKNTIESSRVINHELQRLNKVIVIEQNYSAFRTKKYNDYNPKYLDFLNKNIVLYITAKAQITYNMKEMKVKVDTIHKKVHIISIPEPQLNVYPEVEIYDMDESFFNNFSKYDLNLVMEEGKKDIRKEIESSNLKLQAHNQLINNLKELYSIAQIYNWEIVDDTPYAKELKTINLN